MPLASSLLDLIYQARSRGVHLHLQVSFPNPSLLCMTGRRTFLVSRKLLRWCQLAGQGGSRRVFMGLLSLGTPGRPICRSHGVTPSSRGEAPRRPAGATRGGAAPAGRLEPLWPPSGATSGTWKLRVHGFFLKFLGIFRDT